MTCCVLSSWCLLLKDFHLSRTFEAETQLLERRRGVSLNGKYANPTSVIRDDLVPTPTVWCIHTSCSTSESLPSPTRQSAHESGERSPLPCETCKKTTNGFDDFREFSLLSLWEDPDARSHLVQNSHPSSLGRPREPRLISVRSRSSCSCAAMHLHTASSASSLLPIPLHKKDRSMLSLRGNLPPHSLGSSSLFTCSNSRLPGRCVSA